MQTPTSFADIRQFVRSKTQSEEEYQFLDLIDEEAGDVKYRWFPSDLITSDLEMYQRNLNKWTEEREENDEIIREYNRKVAYYKGLISEFIEEQKAFYAEDNDRMNTENDTVPRGRLTDGKIPVLPDA